MGIERVGLKFATNQRTPQMVRTICSLEAVSLSADGPHFTFYRAQFSLTNIFILQPLRRYNVKQHYTEITAQTGGKPATSGSIHISFIFNTTR